MPSPLTPESFRNDLAEVLHQHPDEVDLQQEPVAAGLDSLRIQTLAERWCDAGVRVSFVELAERGTFAQWWELLSARSDGGGR